MRGVCPRCDPDKLIVVFGASSRSRQASCYVSAVTRLPRARAVLSVRKLAALAIGSFPRGNMLAVDPDLTLGRILNFIGQNLKVDKLFIDMGFDPNHFTWDAVFHRVVEIAWANVNLANMLALVGAIFYVATLMMRTIVPLRVIGIISIAFFIAYGVVAGAVSTFLLYRSFAADQRHSAPPDVVPGQEGAHVGARRSLMDWLRPYMTPRRYKKDDVLFRKGDVANEMFLTVTGKFLVSEIGIEVPPGRIMGELGFVAPKNKRTQTVKCVESGDVLTITYETLLELYFQNPEFGYYLLSLTSERLLQKCFAPRRSCRGVQDQTGPAANRAARCPDLGPALALRWTVSDRLGDAISEECAARRKPDFLGLCLGLARGDRILMATSSASDSFGAAVAVDVNPSPAAIKRPNATANRTLVSRSMMGSPGYFAAGGQCAASPHSVASTAYDESSTIQQRQIAEEWGRYADRMYWLDCCGHCGRRCASVPAGPRCALPWDDGLRQIAIHGRQKPRGHRGDNCRRLGTLQSRRATSRHCIIAA